jgi:hypothetical protein
MHSNPPQEHRPDGLKLADALDRLAGALEQQTRTLLDLKTDVAELAGALKGIESRLAALEDRPAAVPGPTTPKAKPRKRPK